jgi:NADH dehydrogenase (ubiquinone) 1 alpha subcomplex subunit 9
MMAGLCAQRVAFASKGPSGILGSLSVVRTKTDQPEVAQRSNLVLEQNKFPSPAAAALKRGTGGRSSFNGTVCTVFGGGGFIGRSVVNRLGKIGTQVIVPYRGDPYKVKDVKLAGDLGQVLFFPFYLRDEESIYKALKYSNVVINLVGKDSETSGFTFDEVHVEGSRTLARLAREAGVKRFIQVSTLNCSPNPESTIISGGSKFLKTKYLGEEAVREEFPEAIFFRPADVYGHDDRFLLYYSNVWRRSHMKILVWNKGKGVFKQPVYVGDLAQGIANAIFDNEAPGKTYDAVGPRRYELYEIVSYINRCIQRDESYNFFLKDMKYRPGFWIRVYINEMLSKYPKICWDRIEREMVTDTVTPGNPTLEDLGVKLTYLEDRAEWELKRFQRFGYYETELGELPEIAPPKFVTV